MSESFWARRQNCFIIAEIGVNHNGSVPLACQMIDAARAAGADAVKFQTFTADTLVTQGTPKVKYQETTTAASESHFDMIKRLELGRDEHLQVKRYCDAVGIEFLSTPYDIASARFLESLGVGCYKTASADIVDLPLHEYIASTGKPSIIATGMATLDEIAQAMSVYRNAGHQDIVLLHCVSNYPCSDASLNLRAMKLLSDRFSVPVGYSDHSIGSLAAALSVGLGAKVIEKHFTLDKTLPGPDHKASSTPEEFAELVAVVRRSETILGSAVKECQPEERQMSQVSRKSIVLARTLTAGSIIHREDLILMRPGTGLSAAQIPAVVGRRVKTDLPSHHRIALSDLESLS